jgi:hypothetical protein
LINEVNFGIVFIAPAYLFFVGKVVTKSHEGKPVGQLEASDK